jgi:hypothetical protein
LQVYALVGKASEGVNAIVVGTPVDRSSNALHLQRRGPAAHGRRARMHRSPIAAAISQVPDTDRSVDPLRF